MKLSLVLPRYAKCTIPKIYMRQLDLFLPVETPIINILRAKRAGNDHGALSPVGFS